MNVDQWISKISEMYKSFRKPFSADKKGFLVEKVEPWEKLTPSQRKILTEVHDLMMRYFFKKAAQGETFGSLSRVKERFGRTVEEAYEISSGPFLDVAKTYWTYKLEISDILGTNLVLSEILFTIEIEIAAAFFPTPGPSQMPLNMLIDLQRQLLQEYAPDIDIERILSNNPMLKSK